MSDCKSTDAIEDFCTITLLNHVGEQHRHILNELVTYLYDNEFDSLEVVKGDIIDPTGSAIKEYFFVEHKEWSLFAKIKKFIKRNANESKRILESDKLKAVQKYAKLEHFKKQITECIKEVQNKMPQSMNLSNITEVQNALKLNSLSYAGKIALSEFVITKYHQQFMDEGWSMSDFLENCSILRELAHSNKQIYNTAVPQWIRQYIEWFQKNVYKPLPHSKEHWDKQSIDRNINVDLEYLTQIDNALYNGKCFMGLGPFQLNVYIVPFSEHSKKLISEFCDANNNNKVLKLDKPSSMDDSVLFGTHRLLRASKRELNLQHGQTVKLVILRKDPLKSDEDTVYLWRAKNSNNVSHPMARYSEIPWIDNTKADIVPGLNPEKHGILTVSHHLHSDDCERVYLSFEDHGSRVWTEDIIEKLRILFKDGCNKLSLKIEQAFLNCKNRPRPQQTGYRDPSYAKYGEYFFGEMTYHCFEAGWNSENPRANFNLFIDKSATLSLWKSIDEQKAFATNRELYYYLDYTYGMQYQDNGMIGIELESNGSLQLLIDIGLHRNKERLFAVAVKNDYVCKQRWKMSCFMTEIEICTYFFIHKMDIPRGLGNDDFQKEINRIVIDANVITSTNWKNIRIIQSGTNKMHIRRLRKCKGVGHLKVSCKKFTSIVMNSLENQNNDDISSIVSFPFKKKICSGHYLIEKTLTVKYSDDQRVIVTFAYNKLNRKTEVNSICLDLFDCKNKSTLINTANVQVFDSIMQFNKNIKTLRIVQSPKSKKDKMNDFGEQIGDHIQETSLSSHPLLSELLNTEAAITAVKSYISNGTTYYLRM